MIPGEADAKLILLSVRETGGRQSNLLVFQRATQDRPKKRTIRCLVGHRFTAPIEETFRYNLRQLFELYKELFQKLSALLPIFLDEKVK